MLFQNIVFIAHMAATSLQPNQPGPVYYIYLTIHTFKWSEVSVSVYITSAPWLSAVSLFSEQQLNGQYQKTLQGLVSFFYVLWQLLSSENKIISLIIKNKTGEKNPQNYNLCKQ